MSTLGPGLTSDPPFYCIITVMIVKGFSRRLFSVSSTALSCELFASLAQEIPLGISHPIGASYFYALRQQSILLY